jgi:hypothetical protein
MQWAKDNGYKHLNNKNFVGLALSYDPDPIPSGFTPID